MRANLRCALRALVTTATALAVTGMSGCLDFEPVSSPRPAYYADLAAPGARLDPSTTAQIVNAYRANHGLGALVWDRALTELAEREARQRAEAGELREMPGSGLDQALKSQGFAPNRVMRSITGGYHSFADAFSGWRGARHHDAVLRMAEGQRFGLAAVARPGSRHRVYWVLLVAPRT